MLGRNPYWINVIKELNKWLNRRERIDIYLTYVWRLLWSIERLEEIFERLELSANTVAFTSCRLEMMFTGTVSGLVGRGKAMSFSRCLCQKTVWIRESCMRHTYELANISIHKLSDVIPTANSKRHTNPDSLPA